MPRPLSEWQDEIAAEMLEDLEEITGVSIGEMMADALEIPEPLEPSDVSPSELYRADESGEFEVFAVYDEPTEDRPLDMDNPNGMDTDDYFDVLFDHIDVDADTEVDTYGDEGN